MKKSLLCACLLVAVLAGMSCRCKCGPAEAAFSDAQLAALHKAVAFAESKEIVHATFADLTTGPAGSGQQAALAAKLAHDNLSMFCLTGPLGREEIAADYDFATPAPDQIAPAALRTAERGTVVDLADLSEIVWQDEGPDRARGSFRFDTTCGNRGVCLFEARREGAAWNVTRLAVRKKDSDALEDGCLVFDRSRTPGE